MDGVSNGKRPEGQTYFVATVIFQARYRQVMKEAKSRKEVKVTLHSKQDDHLVNKWVCVYGRKRGELRYSALTKEWTNLSRKSPIFEMLISTAYRFEELVPLPQEDLSLISQKTPSRKRGRGGGLTF